MVSDLSQTGSSYIDTVQAMFYYAILLASRSATSSRAGRKLDSVMEIGRELVCHLLGSWTA